MHSEIHLALHRVRAAELQAQAHAHGRALDPRPPRDLRVRLGWTLVEVGLRLVAPPRSVAVPQV